MKNKKLEGIGGWLWFPIISFGITIIFSLLEIVEFIQLYYLEDIYFYILLDCVIIAIIGITLYKIFKKDYTTPKWAIASLIIVAIINVLSGLYFAIIGTIIWVTYFNKSERVKNTFGSQNRRRTK